MVKWHTGETDQFFDFGSGQTERGAGSAEPFDGRLSVEMKSPAEARIPFRTEADIVIKAPGNLQAGDPKGFY